MFSLLQRAQNLSLETLAQRCGEDGFWNEVMVYRGDLGFFFYFGWDIFVDNLLISALLKFQ